MTMPKIKAAFTLKKGEPVVAYEEGDTRHYSVKLSVEGAPDDTRSVTYRLHETFYDPIREVRRERQGKANDFEEEIETYGDFEILTTVRSSEGETRVRRGLTAALLETHGEDANEAIKKAIREIAGK